MNTVAIAPRSAALVVTFNGRGYVLARQEQEACRTAARSGGGGEASRLRLIASGLDVDDWRGAVLKEGGSTTELDLLVDSSVVEETHCGYCRNALSECNCGA